MGCLWWWTSKKCDKHLGEEVKAIREDISASMDQLVATNEEVFAKLPHLPWSLDSYFNSALNGRDLPL
ncbi:uncharacterized protein [Physcomitrium patens]|uniref:uncharacterized protein isoform X2 n=1 Tax=Physcomitrium patens TaxID=3218 RepID=UPI003CCE30C7